ncbi:MAG: hypothetical protein Q4B03_06335 [Lachnospiraceae bacterium]|nr:hypothetical protein [Lachnospiraceae bacterium]
MGEVAFQVNTGTLRTDSRELRNYSRELHSVNAAVRAAMKELRHIHSSAPQINISLGRITGRMERCAGTTGTMAQVLEDIAVLYGNTETTLGQGYSMNHSGNAGNGGNSDTIGPVTTGIIAAGLLASLYAYTQYDKKKKQENIENSRPRYSVDSVVFDEDGSFGGNQGAPQKLRGAAKKSVYAIVRKYYRNMSDWEIAKFLKVLNSEGCSYVASVNTIFAAYQGRESEFEQTFGIPMYRDGDLNFNELLVDFYCQTDNHYMNENGFDYYDISDDPGADWEEQHYRLEKYLSDHDAYVHTSFENITPKNFSKYAENGYVILHYSEGTIRNADGTAYQSLKGVGHAMTITGVTTDGRFIVSSWGKTYYIDPSEGNCGFSYYQYKQK